MLLPDQMQTGLKCNSVYSGLIPILKLCIKFGTSLSHKLVLLSQYFIQVTEANPESVLCDVAGIILKMIFFKCRFIDLYSSNCFKK